MHHMFGKIVTYNKEEIEFCLEKIDPNIPSMSFGEQNHPFYSIDTIISALKKVASCDSLREADILEKNHSFDGVEWVMVFC